MKVFAIAFAAAMCAIAAGHTRHINNTAGNHWVLMLGPAAGYVVLAIAHLWRDIPLPLKHLLALVALSQVGLWEPELFTLPNHPAITIAAIVFLIGGGWELATRGDATRPRRLQGLLRRLTYPQSLILVGAALVLATPFFPMAFGPPNTDSRWPGWLVLAGRTPWVTADIGLAGAPFGSSYPALSPIFNASGRAFYVVALAAALAGLGLLAAMRFSGERLRGSRSARRLAAAALLVAAWAATDLFWGWHFDLTQMSWAVYLGLGCWGAGLLYAAVTAARIARRGLAGLRGFVLFQLPFVAFNCAMLPLYWESDVNFAGLGLLFLGTQAQAWGYASLLLGSAGERSEETRAAAAGA